MIIDSGIATGSLQVSGSFSVQGSTNLDGGLVVLGGITGSISGSSTTTVSASFAQTADTAINAPYYVLTASYTVDSSSFSTRTTNLESWSSSLDAIYATDAQLNASASALQAGVTASINVLSSSVAPQIAALQSWSSSLDSNYATDAQLNASASALQAGVTASINVATQNLQAGVTASIAAFATTGSNTFTGTNSFNTVSASYIQALSASIEYLSVIYQTSSVTYSSGSNQFGDGPSDVQTLYGTVDVKNGPLLVTGSINVTSNVYGNLVGTASYIEFAQTASLALTAQNANTASYVQNAQTASYVQQAQTASYVQQAQNAYTASYVEFAQTASLALTAQNANTASYVETAQSASYVANAVSASRASSALNADTASYVNFAQTASLALTAQNANTASYVETAQSASYVQNAQTASFVQQAQNAYTASYVNFAQTASLALTALNSNTASYVETARTASYVQNAQSASYVTLAQSASYVNFAQSASYVENARTASFVEQAQNAYTASYILSTNVQGPNGPDSITNAVNATNAPYYVLTASYNADSASVSTRVTNLESFSSSLDTLFVNNAELNAATGSLQAGVTASINLATGSLQAGVSASIAGFATTGSNQFKASQFVTGSIISTANIQANKFISTDGVVNESTTGQLMYATNGGYMYLYTGVNGLYINNQANDANNVVITNAGAVTTRGKLTVGAPGNNQDIAFGGSDAKLDWAGTGAQIFYSAGALQFSSVNGSNNMILQNGGGALFSSGITGSLQATNGVISSSAQLAGAGFATTASNTFTGAQYISNTTNATSFTSTPALYTDGGLRVTKDSYVSGGLWVAGDLTVYGTSSISYVTTSVFVGLEYINLNTDLPALRYAGINVGDSGSAVGISSSFWYDSEKDNWLYVHAHQGTDETSSLAINGPITYNNLGNEQGLLANYITKGQLVDANNNHHITSSQIYDDGTTVAIAGNLQVTGSLRAGNLTGSLNGSNLVDGTVTNAKLQNSAITIASTSTSLGGSITAATILSGTGVFSGSAQIPNTSITNAQLANSAVTVTAGTGLSGGGSVSLGGSVTLTNAGVTSAVAGTGVSVSSATGAVTISIGQAVNTNSNVTFGNITSTNQFVTISSGTAALNLSGSATQGGSTFFDFIRASNTAVGSTNINKSIRINSTGAMEWVNSAYSAVILTLTDAGALTAAADVTAFSDARLKENVNTITGALEKVGRLRGVTYNRIDLEDKSERLGFIAQEVKEVIPQVVLGSEEETYSVAYGNITALHNEAIKELKAEIEELKGIISTLINK